MNATQTRFFLEVTLDNYVATKLSKLHRRMVELLAETHEGFAMWIHSQPSHVWDASFGEVIDHYLSELDLEPTSEAWLSAELSLTIIATAPLGINPNHPARDIAFDAIELCINGADDIPVDEHVHIWDVIEPLLGEINDDEVRSRIMRIFKEIDDFDGEFLRFLTAELL